MCRLNRVWRKLFKIGCAIYYWGPNLGCAKPTFYFLVAQILNAQMPPLRIRFRRPCQSFFHRLCFCSQSNHYFNLHFSLFHRSSVLASVQCFVTLSSMHCQSDNKRVKSISTTIPVPKHLCELTRLISIRAAGRYFLVKAKELQICPYLYKM